MMQKMGLGDAKKLALSCLKETMEEKINKNNVEMMVISNATCKVERVCSQAVKTILDDLK